MQRKLLFLLVQLMTANALPAQDDFFAAADRFLSQWVNAKGEVDYRGIAAQPSGLDSVMRRVETFRVTEETAEAFYINAYNLVMIRSVVGHLPLSSPLDVKGIFDAEKWKVAGEMITLGDIEKLRLLQPYRDPRIHFVLVCGARGCPQLASWAYHPRNLSQQLEERTRYILAQTNLVRVNAQAKTLALSEIFKWYEKDFEPAKGVVAFLNRYLGVTVTLSWVRSYYPYDWSLNQGNL